MTKKADRISCHKCKFFYVTWDNSFPYGCKAMGFKGKITPSMMVFQASGKTCMAYEEKAEKGSEEKNKN